MTPDAARYRASAARVATRFAGFLLACACGIALAGDGARFAGRTLAAALEQLRAEGLNVIFSSGLVRPDMTVAEDPPPGSPRATLEALLRPHGLTAVPGPGHSLLVVRAGEAGAPHGRLRGAVLRVGGGPPPAAQVRVGTRRRVAADARGAFDLELPAGTYRVTVIAPGFRPWTRDGVRVIPEGVTELEVELAPGSAVRESILVEATQPRQERDDTREVLSGEELASAPLLADDPLRSIARLAGTADSDLAAGVNVRGGNSDEVMVLLDGLELHDPFHVRDVRGGLFSIIDSETVGEVDYFGGAFPVRYGNRLSGVIDISSATPLGPPQTTLTLGSFQSRAASRGSFGADRGLWLVSARAGYPEDVVPSWVATESYRPRYYDVFGKLQYRWSPHVALAGNVLFGLDESSTSGRFEESLPTDEGPIFASTRFASRYAWVSLSWTPRDDLESRTVLSTGGIGHDRRVRREEELFVRDDRDFSFAGLTQDWRYAPPGRHQVTWGVALRRVRTDYDYAFVDEGAGAEFGPVPSGWEYSAYLSDAVRIVPAVLLEVGLRYDRETYTGDDDGQFGPRLNLTWRAAEKTTLRGAWGRFHQSQRIQELQVEDGVASFYPAEASNQTVIGLDQGLPAKLVLHVGVYDKRVGSVRPRYENLFDPTGFFPEREADRVRIAPDRARLRGAELSLRGPEGRALGWSVSYTRASANDLIEGVWVPRAWDQRHAFDAGVDYDLNGRWSFGLAGSYHSGWPTTALLAEYGAGAGGVPEFHPAPGPRNRERFPDYWRLDLRVARSFTVRRSRAEVVIDLTNLLDRRNVCCVAGFDYALEADGSVTVTPQLKRGLPRTIGASLTWRF